MKINYFKQDKGDEDDIQLVAAKIQGYVPETCLLGGIIVMSEISRGKNPCSGCNCDRDRCHGKVKI